MTPEISIAEEEIESTITWIKLLLPHPQAEKKRLIMELHSFGEISADKVSALFTILDLGAA